MEQVDQKPHNIGYMGSLFSWIVAIWHVGFYIYISPGRAISRPSIVSSRTRPCFSSTWIWV